MQVPHQKPSLSAKKARQIPVFARACVLWALTVVLSFAQGDISVRADGDSVVVEWLAPNLSPDTQSVVSPSGRLEISDDLSDWEPVGSASPQRLSGIAQTHAFTVSRSAGASFYRVVIEPLDLKGANLSGRDLTGMDLSEMDLTGTNFDRAILDRVNFAGSTLTMGSFVGAQAVAANFGRTSGENVKFSGATLSGSRFKKARLPGADFSAALLNKSNFGDAKVAGANFSESDLRRADFDDGAVADEANFAKALLGRTVLAQSSFKGANFADADMTLADMRLADFNGADFEGADLTAADTGWAEFEEATGLVEVNNAVYFIGNAVSITGRARGGAINWAIGF